LRGGEPFLGPLSHATRAPNLYEARKDEEMAIEGFFDESSEQSIIKTTLVTKYFWAWASVITATLKKQGGERIAYIDLFAGPGRYQDGTKSTPLLVLEKAIQDPNLREMLVTVFNDADTDHSQSLKTAVQALSGIETLTYPPIISTQEVGEEIVKTFEQMKLVPTFFFVDPWGYKGLSLRLVNSVLKDWGCDCIFFFNYNRINMGLGNPFVEEHMNALFGQARADQLRVRLATLTADQRELAIVEEIAQSLKEMGGRYVLPFGFVNDRGTRTSHHLIFVSKHFKGYEIMKEIMAGESSSAYQGVPSFRYNPAERRFPTLFELTRPLDDLAEMLMAAYSGRRVTMRQLYEAHNVGRPYIAKNYKDVLIQLEAAGKITADPPASQRPRRHGVVTFGDKVQVVFPHQNPKPGS
jgi:three-Cys-motif partner protein